MDRFDLELNLVSGFSFLEELSCGPASGASNSIRSGHSVQILDPPHCDQLSRQVISPALGSPQALSDYLIHCVPSYGNILAYPGLISQEDLDEIVPVDCTVTDLATTNCQQNTHTISEEQSSLTEPLLDSVAEACPLAESRQQPLQTEPVGSTPGQSHEDSLTTRISEACQRGYQRGYHRAYHAALRAELNLSDDMAKARHAARAAGRAAGKAERERVKATLDFVPASLRAVTPALAYSKAYAKAHRTEMNLSGDRMMAKRAGRSAGQAAAKVERERAKNSRSAPSSPRERYQRAYHRAYRAEMLLSGDVGRAKKAGQAAGRDAFDAAKKAVAECAKESSSVVTPGCIPIKPLP